MYWDVQVTQNYDWLVVEPLLNPTPLESMRVSWDDEIPNYGKVKVMFQSPPTSLYIQMLHGAGIFTYPKMTHSKHVQVTMVW